MDVVCVLVRPAYRIPLRSFPKNRRVCFASWRFSVVKSPSIPLSARHRETFKAKLVERRTKLRMMRILYVVKGYCNPRIGGDGPT